MPYVLIETRASGLDMPSFEILGIYDSIGKAKMIAYKYVIETHSDFEEWEEVYSSEQQLFKLERTKDIDSKKRYSVHIEKH